MEEKREHEEKTQIVAILVASETKCAVNDYSNYYHSEHPDQMRHAVTVHADLRVADDRLRNVNGHRNERNEGNGNDKAKDLPNIGHTEEVFCAHADEQSNRDRKHQLQNEVNVSEGQGSEDASRVLRKIRHKALEIHGGKNGEGKTVVARKIAKQSALCEYCHRENRIVCKIAPTNYRGEYIGAFVTDAVKYSAVDNVDESVAEHKAEKSDGAKYDGNCLEHLEERVVGTFRQNEK